MNFIIQCFVNRKSRILAYLYSFEVSYFDFAERIKYLLKMKLKELIALSYAEIMITMGILGIVATHILPVVYSEFQRSLTMIKLQKEYAVFFTGIDSAIKENGSPDNWGLIGAGDATGLSNLNVVVSQYFRLNKNCNAAEGCFPDTNYKNMKGIDNPVVLNDDTGYTKFRLADGTSVALTQLDETCNLDWGDTEKLQHVCGEILLDINGNSGPNTYGKDLFGFILTKYGLVPMGTSEQTSGQSFNAACSQNSNANFKYENGLSCTAWILYNNNMDYLDCNGLNWKNKTSCKG